MIAAVDILDDVEVGVTALNGEIVRRAFHGTCCKFLVNQDEFRSLLARYIELRMTIHRAGLWWRRGNYEYELDLPPRYWTRLSERKFEAEGIRSQLKKLWPCAACIWLYNPTHRLRRFPELAC